MPEHHEQTFQNEPLKNLRHNIHQVCGQDVVRVQADIDRRIYDYFFHHVIAYTHGARQAVISLFFQRFYEACMTEGIRKVWDEESAPKILEILNNLNFNKDDTRRTASECINERPSITTNTDNVPRHTLD